MRRLWGGQRNPAEEPAKAGKYICRSSARGRETAAPVPNWFAFMLSSGLRAYKSLYPSARNPNDAHGRIVGSGSADAGRDGRLRNTQVRVIRADPSLVPADATRTIAVEEPSAVVLPVGCRVPGAARVDCGWPSDCKARVRGEGTLNGFGGDEGLGWNLPIRAKDSRSGAKRDTLPGIVFRLTRSARLYPGASRSNRNACRSGFRTSGSRAAVTRLSIDPALSCR